MSILKVENLYKTYGTGETQVKALDNVSFLVEQGEFVAIVGSSGSGKSTLLHIIGGVDKPTSGKVFIEGEDLYSLNDEEQSRFRRNKIGLVYQFYNLIPTLNVRENIFLPVTLDNKKLDQDYLDILINMLNLNNRETHLPNELSGGEQQRVSIGRALFSRPSLLLCDEPTGNLDHKNSLEIMELLKKSNEEFHQTIIMITHDLSLAHYASRIISIEDGKIISDERVS